MATSTVRNLSSEELSMVCMSLELQAKSAVRASRAAQNSVIASEYTKQAAMCRNLIAHFRSGSLEV